MRAYNFNNRHKIAWYSKGIARGSKYQVCFTITCSSRLAHGSVHMQLVKTLGNSAVVMHEALFCWRLETEFIDTYADKKISRTSVTFKLNRGGSLPDPR